MTMRIPVIRFTVRRLIVLVALVGLNLAAVIATSRFYPREKLDGKGTGGAYLLHTNRPDVSFVIYKARMVRSAS